MADEAVYLRPDAVVEPLVMQWRAWSHLVSPATAAVHVAKRHVEIMRSFVQQPRVHHIAARTPALAGGPFIDLDESHAGAVGDLLAETLERQKPLLQLADALAEAGELVAGVGPGAPLEPLYDRVPEPLRGLIEFTRDCRGQAAYRLIEPLLYHSRFNPKPAQAFALRRLDPDNRPFVLSTPDVEEDGRLLVRQPFDSPEMRLVLEGTDHPQPLSRFAQALGCDRDTPLLRELFWAVPPATAAPHQGDGVRVRYFGHATLLVEHGGFSVLTDPIVSPPVTGGIPRFSWNDLPATIDQVVITHNHKDHFCLESLLRLRHRIRGSIIVPASSQGGLNDPSLRLVLEQLGFASVVEMPEMGMIPIPGGRIVGVPFLGEHGDLDIRSKLAYLIGFGGRQMLVAADSNNLDTALYARIREALGPVDTLFVSLECEGAPVSWLYGPLLPGGMTREQDQARRLSASDDARALAMAEALGARSVKIYAMGLEPWLRFFTGVDYAQDSTQMRAARRLCAALEARGIDAEICCGRGEWTL